MDVPIFGIEPYVDTVPFNICHVAQVHSMRNVVADLLDHDSLVVTYFDLELVRTTYNRFVSAPRKNNERFAVVFVALRHVVRN